MTFISYAQNLEDVMLWRALKHVEHGYYVDVGANDPKHLSITRAFYDRGWHGINIDPVTFAQLAQERTRDVNLELAVSNTEGEISFFEVPDSALCTPDPDVASRYRQAGNKVTERKVRSLTLNQILAEHAEASIHFMNIDVEGGELQVLQGLDLVRWRPWILLIEATIPTTTIPSHENWETLITSSNYEFAYFDGLNRFYVAKEHQELIDAFRLPPNIFDEYVFSREIDNQQFFEKELLAKESALQAKEEAIQAQKRELDIKEKYIQDSQTSYAFWIKNGPLRRSSLLQALIHFRRNFLPKVGVLEQYHPKQLFVPASYAQASQVTLNQILPSIAIVTPSYNQGEFIERTIRSVLDQQYPNLEYIVQDGNSTDDTLAVLNSYQEKLTQFNSNQDNGQAHAINLGFQHTSGEIMAYLNSDDILLPGTLSYVADYFTRHPDVDVVYGHRIIINEQDQEIGRWVLPPHNDQSILWKDYIPQETLFWRRSLWEKIGGRMDESFQFALDWDLLIRFQTAGAKFSRLPRFLAAFRLHAGQKTGTQIHSVGLSEEHRLLKQVHGREVSREEINQKMSPYLRRSLFYHSLYHMGIFRY